VRGRRLTGEEALAEGMAQQGWLQQVQRMTHPVSPLKVTAEEFKFNLLNERKRRQDQEY
jgi:hypothetical protein